MKRINIGLSDEPRRASINLFNVALAHDDRVTTPAQVPDYA